MREEKKSTPVPLAPWKFVVLIVAGVLLSVCASAEETAFPSPKDAIPQSELSSDYAEPIISIDEVLNPASSMEGAYPVHAYGSYGGLYFWMDNHRLVFSVLDKEEKDQLIISWDVDRNQVARIGFGRIVCYENGMVRKSENRPDLPAHVMRDLFRGPLGQEKKERTFDKRPRVYGNQFECNEPRLNLASVYAESHQDEMVFPLREEDGFLVTAKRTMFPDGRTKEIIYQDHIVYHRPENAPLNISVSSKGLVVPAYYPFIKAYLLGNTDGVYALSPDGKLQSIDYSKHNSGRLVLSRRGLLWLRGSVLPQSDNGLYLSRGEQVKRISSENVQDGKVSPNGCRLAYTTTHVDFFGQITRPTLKVIDLCKGDKSKTKGTGVDFFLMN
jgi:hypothetical protein